MAVLPFWAVMRGYWITYWITEDILPESVESAVDSVSAPGPAAHAEIL